MYIFTRITRPITSFSAMLNEISRTNEWDEVKNVKTVRENRLGESQNFWQRYSWPTFPHKLKSICPSWNYLITLQRRQRRQFASKCLSKNSGMIFFFFFLKGGYMYNSEPLKVQSWLRCICVGAHWFQKFPKKFMVSYGEKIHFCKFFQNIWS